MILLVASNKSRNIGLLVLLASAVTLQALHLLSHAFLHLHLNQFDATTVDLKDCHTLLDGLHEQQGLEVMQLRAHLLVLGVSLSLARGSLKDLELGG